MAKKVTKKTSTKKKTAAKKKTTSRTARSAAPKAKAAAVTQIADEQIRTRAFEIYRSGRNQDADADWLQAEQELKAQPVRSA